MDSAAFFAERTVFGVSGQYQKVNGKQSHECHITFQQFSHTLPPLFTLGMMDCHLL